MEAGMSATMELPPFFDPARAGDWSYQPDADALRAAAEGWRREIRTAGEGRTDLLLIDLQRDFCLPEGALYVGGRSGRGAVEDTARIAAFIHRNLGVLDRIVPTFDTHTPLQIFQRSFWIDADGRPPAPFTVITGEMLADGSVRPSPGVLGLLPADVAAEGAAWVERQLLHYARSLARQGRNALIIWPDHCLIGSEGHAMPGLVQEARLFHALLRGVPTPVIIKGDDPWSESYSAFGPEVPDRWDSGRLVKPQDDAALRELLRADRIVVAGQASSHCVRWSVDDLLQRMRALDPALPGKVYVLRDCMSAVVALDAEGRPIPALDFTPQAEEAFGRWAELGVHIVESAQPMADWPR
jgi:nicotinamidase-related amidase